MFFGAQRAVFLDRDGILNYTAVIDGKPYAPRLVEEFSVYQNAHEPLQKLKAAGYILIVVSNQPDVGNGRTPREVVEEMNTILKRTLPLDSIKVCFHSQHDFCQCRKPKPGMLTSAAVEWDIDLSKSYIVGDRWSDIAAGRAAGCRTVFIDRGYRESKEVSPDFAVRSLGEAVEHILQ